MRLRTAMIAVAALAVLLGVGSGLRRRAGRLERLARLYGRQAQRLEDRLVAPGPGLQPPQAEQFIEAIHWNDAVADRYRAAAARPWLPLEPDPQTTVCACGAHASRRAPSSTTTRRFPANSGA